MSSRQAVVEVHGPLKQDPPHAGHFAIGVLLPAIVIGLELASRICADAFFDPMPTWCHVALVAMVPASNLAVYLFLSETRSAPPRALLVLSGASLAIAAFYTLIFVPLLPLAMVALLVGIGVLPFAPLGGLVTAWQLNRRLRARTHPLLIGGLPLRRRTYAWSCWAGIAAGVLALAALDARVAVTRTGAEMAQSQVPGTRDQGLWLLRTFGDEELLLRYCYDTTGRPQGLITAVLLMLEGRRSQALSPAAARETFYRVTGEPFNARPAPFAGARANRWDAFARDQDQGGTDVAGRVNGLSLAASRIDGSINGDDAVAYLEWTLEFKNTSPVMREARVQIALPPGGVVSRATLWVNGEEREAAFASRAAARAAYQNVVRRSQDPLLVTTKGADRVLAQAFPLQPNGGKIKVRLGMTAPLELVSAGEARLVLPAILDRNFTFAPEQPHSVWIEGKQAMATAATALEAGLTANGYARLSGNLSDAALSETRTVIGVARDPKATLRLASVVDDPPVSQEIRKVAGQDPQALMIVIDGSRRMRAHTPALREAIAAIPDGSQVGLIIARDTPVIIPLAPWGAAQAAAFRKSLALTAFIGGADNTDAIIAALKALEPVRDARILWVHAAQPVAFSQSRPRFEQAAARMTRLAPLTLYAVESGANQLLTDAPWAWSARSLPRIGTTAGDLAAYLKSTFAKGERLEIVRGEAGEAADAPRGSDHIARLWANGTILQEALRNPTGDHAESVKIAAAYQLVTPVSGAVVLETARQYQEAGLTPVMSGTVPTVPEPHEWALLFLVLLTLTWVGRQQMISKGGRQ